MSRLNRKRGRKSKYVHSLNTPYWKEVKRRVLIRDRCCQICGSKLFLEVHHLIYFYKGVKILGKELEYLFCMKLLCSEHHEVVHKDETHKFNPKNFNR